MFDLTTLEGLREACEEAEREYANTEQHEGIFQLLKYIQNASDEERKSEEFHHKIWKENPIYKFKIKARDEKHVDLAIKDIDVRNELAEKSKSPLPDNPQEKIDFLNEIRSYIIDDIFEDVESKPRANTTRMLAALFPTEFTTLIVDTYAPHINSNLLKNMNVKPDKSFIGRHRQVLDRLEEALGLVAKDDLRRLIKRMTLAEKLSKLMKENIPPNRSPEPDERIAQNTILYGPPGTGKTYSIRQRALELVLGWDKGEASDLSAKEVTESFHEYQENGHIEFATFHQSYGYEEFIEGLRPILDDDNNDVRYELHKGIFKSIAIRASKLRQKSEKIEKSNFDQLWQRLIDMVEKYPDRTYPSTGGTTSYQIKITGREGVEVYPPRNTYIVSKKLMRNIWTKIYINGHKPIKLNAHILKKYDVITKSFVASRFVYERLIELNNTTISQNNVVSDYEDHEHKSIDYVLIIDEINRGNISKILGELITLLESDKRIGAENELRLPLAYSPESRFGVPPNLHILGTMNTADRSIALMDAALRRRFTFEEVMPDKDCIQEVLGNILGADSSLVSLIVDLFETLNKRIRFLYDRDHQIGHAYFLRVRSLEDLRLVFVDRVIPLLQEYFYGDWNKICMVLGCPYDDAGKPKRNADHLRKGTAYHAPIMQASDFSEEGVLGFESDEQEDRLDFTVTPAFQNGTMEEGDLVRTFLGVLLIEKQGDFEKRLRELMGNTPLPAKDENDETPEDAS